MSAAVHIRNVFVNVVSNYHLSKVMVFMWREAALAAGWQILSDGGNPAWTDPSNVYLELTDVELDSLAATEVYSATGGFTSGMEGKIISIYGNDQNRGMYNVRRYIDTNTILIDERCRYAAWTDETGISVKVHNGGVGTPPENGNVTFAAPSGSGKETMYWNIYAGSGNTVNWYMRARPLGDTIYTSTLSDVVGYSTQDFRFNAFFGDTSATHFYSVIYAYDSAGWWHATCLGEVSSRAVGDDRGGFIQQLVSTTDWDVGIESPMYMLSELSAPISAYPMYYKYGLDANVDSMRERTNLAQRINSGRAKTFRPLVMTEHSPEGGYMKGLHPMEFCHSGWPDFEEFAGSYWKLGSNVLVPKNGSTDPTPLASVAA